MRFTIEVGERVKHTVEFSFNQLFGRSLLKVDGEQVFCKKRWFSEPVADNYELEIEGSEKVRVRIEKERKHLFGSKYKIYIDNRLTHLYHGA